VTARQWQTNIGLMLGVPNHEHKRGPG
jgi:hypothetical protein